MKRLYRFDDKFAFFVITKMIHIRFFVELNVEKSARVKQEIQLGIDENRVVFCIHQEYF